MKSKRLRPGNPRGRQGGFSPVVAAVVALQALAFIALGALTQTELHVTVLDLVISAGAIATVFGTARLATPRKAARAERTQEMDAIEVADVLRRITVHAPHYAETSGPLAERPLAERLKLAKLQRPAFPARFLRDTAAVGGIEGEADG